MTKKRNGIAIIVCMAFLAIFTALAVGMIGMADTNMQLARNQHGGSLAFNSAQSGLEVMRYWLKDLSMPGTSSATAKMQKVQALLQGKFTAAGLTNIRADYNNDNTVTVPIVALDAATGQNFRAVFSLADSNKKLQAKIIGSGGQASKQVVVDFNFVTVGNDVFDYGVATKGPLDMQGNIIITGLNVFVDSSVYIESADQTLALIMTGGKTSIGGEVSIARSDATVDVGKNCAIGGLKGAAAVAQKVHIGVDKADFPVPNPEYFEHYVENTYGSGVNTNTDGTLTNTRILAGTNPSFAAGTTINGVLYIEKPNTVEFAGHAVINGIIITEGDIDDPPSSERSLTFRGTVDARSVDTLPDNSHFSELKNEKGTFLMAPGYSVSFGGTFGTVNGAIVANGIEFFGTAGGTIKGSVIDYGAIDPATGLLKAMSLKGTTDLYFNRSGTTENPAGFSPHQKLVFMPNSYSESL